MFDLIVIEARDEAGETCSRRTFEIQAGLSEFDERTEIEGLVAHAHPAAVKCSDERNGTYVEPGKVITALPIVPPQVAFERDQHRLFAA